MKKKVMGIIAVVAIAAIAGYNTFTSQNDVKLSDLALANVEALARGEAGFGCGRAAYEWDDDWHEDTKYFTKCAKGCPEGEGTTPKYMDCD